MLVAGGDKREIIFLSADTLKKNQINIGLFI